MSPPRHPVIITRYIAPTNSRAGGMVAHHWPRGARTRLPYDDRLDWHLNHRAAALAALPKRVARRAADSLAGTWHQDADGSAGHMRWTYTPTPQPPQAAPSTPTETAP